MDTTSAPTKVQLDFDRKPHAALQRVLSVTVSNYDTGEILFTDSLAETAAWLKIFGYEYVRGTDAVWRKHSK